jgi:hypothetical protein
MEPLVRSYEEAVAMLSQKNIKRVIVEDEFGNQFFIDNTSDAWDFFNQ